MWARLGLERTSASDREGPGVAPARAISDCPRYLSFNDPKVIVSTRRLKRQIFDLHHWNFSRLIKFRIEFAEVVEPKRFTLNLLAYGKAARVYVRQKCDDHCT